MTTPLPLTDSFGRRLDYLRISLTERCDLRCVYCRPRDDASPVGADVLSAEEVIAISRAALRLGVRRIRLTGGEPLLRDDLEGIIARLRQLAGLEDLSLTTNGQALAARADSLAAAGLMRVNVSVDSLDPGVYAATTGGGHLRAVRRGLEAALAAGLNPVKANVVLNSPAASERDGLGAFVELVERQPIHVRFIEAMPVCPHVVESSGVGCLPAQRVLDELAKRAELTPVPGPEGGGPARYYRLNGCLGSIGIITPISEPFCARCNRLRVSARGELRPCLFSSTALPLLPALRGPKPTEGLGRLLRRAAACKPQHYHDIAASAGIPAMHAIGG